jgi:hypothetical protein
MEQRLKIAMRIILLTIIGLLLYLMSISQIKGDVFNLNGIRGKDLSVLFDGKLDQNYNVGNSNEPLAIPFESWLVLDSIYNLTEFKYYVGPSVPTEGFTIRFFDVNRKEVGSYITTSTIYRYYRWNTVPIPRNGVRFIQFQVFDMQVNWDGINEFQFYGQAIAKAPTIMPAKYNYKPVDLGVYAHGVNTLGDRINKVITPGDTALKKVAKAVRWYWHNSEFDYYPETYWGRLEDSRTFLGRFGYNHSGNLLNTFKRWDIKPMMAAMGGSIKWIADTNIAKKNDTWLGYAMEERKYTEKTANPENDTAWKPLAKRYASLISLYGKSKGFTNSFGGDTTSGQGQMEIFEWDNEPNGWWKQYYFHSPRAYYKAIKNIYNEGKKADPTSKIYAAALPGIDTSYWRAVYFVHYLENGIAPFPADGFNFNMYLNDGDLQRQGTVGLSPEKFNIHGVLTAMQEFFNRFYGKPVQWTEYGYAVEESSPYDVPDRITQVNYTLRLKAITQTVPLISRMYYYAFFEDNSWAAFHTMGLFRDSNDWKTVIPYPIAYALAQELYIERHAPWFSELVKNGGDTGVWVTKKGNLYKIWKASGSASYTLPGPAKIYRVNASQWMPDSTTGQTITASEAITWALVDPTQPPPPVTTKTIKAIIKTEYRDSATNKLIRTATATIYLR